MSLLSLERQEYYRSKYQITRPAWQPSTVRYEALVRRHIETAPISAQEEMCILDAGCGAGGIMERLSSRADKTIGLDLDFRSLLRHRNNVVELVTGNLTCLPFRDERFDLVVSSWVLEHLQAPQAAFKEIARVLKQGGHFIFLTPNANNIITLLNRSIPHHAQQQLVRKLYGRAEQDTFHVCYQANTPQTITVLAQNAGLHCLQLETVSDPTYLAFNDVCFAVSVLVEHYLPAQNYVHLLGDLIKG